MERWIVDENGDDVKVNFHGVNGSDEKGREYRFIDADTVYRGFFDKVEGAFQVNGEFTPHLDKFTGHTR